MNKRVLIVDDEQHLCEHLSRYFIGKGFEATTAFDGATGIESAKAEHHDLMLLDLRLPDMSGLEVLRQVKEACPAMGIIMITGYGDVKMAVKAIQTHADHFLLKPVSFDVLEEVTNAVLKRYCSTDEYRSVQRRTQQIRFDDRMRQLILPDAVVQSIELLASNTYSNVLILGETGSGKGMIAKTIHELSDRRDAPFVDINCAGLSGSLLESELFGHEKGAFTDAKNAKRGLLETAEGGSVLLDEVGELTPGVQAKLLTAIEDKRFRRLGGNTPIRVDTRIMAATNRNLEALVREGRFRSDLYYRLNVIPITLPPLRERGADVMPLFKMFLAEFAAAFSKDVTSCASEAGTILRRYAWPGNIRELRNVAERAVLMCEGRTIHPAHLPDNVTSRKVARRVTNTELATLESVELEHIQRVLAHCEGNRSHAATVLGIHRTTLLKKIRKYGLT